MFKRFLLTLLAIPLLAQNIDVSRIRNIGFVSVLSYGADNTGTNFSDSAFASALAASLNVIIPAGTYKFAQQVTMSQIGQHIVGAGSNNVNLVFTGATHGLDMYAGATNTMVGNSVSGLTITTTNSGGNSCLIVDSNAHPSSSIFLEDIFCTTNPVNGPAQWLAGFRFLGNQGAETHGLRAYGNVVKAFVLGDNSAVVTSVKMFGNTCGAIEATGKCMELNFAQQITDTSGYYQAAQTAMMTVDASSVLTITGAELDSGSGGNTVPDGIVSNGILTINSLVISGSGFTNCIRVESGRAAISHVFANVSASTNVVQMRNDSPGSVLRDSNISNSHATGAGVFIGFGTASAATGNTITTVGGPAIKLGSGGVNIDLSSNRLVSSTGFGVLLPGDGTTYSFKDDNTDYIVTDLAHICGNCDGGGGAAIQPPNMGSSGRTLNGVIVPDTLLAASAAVASATTIVPTARIFHVTGTTAIVNITPPYSGFSGCVVLIPDGLWTTTAAGNIALASTAVVNKALTLCYDGNFAVRKWFPSY